MATLVREKPSLKNSPATTTGVTDDELRSNVPSPFPRDFAQELLDELAAEEIGLDSLLVNAEPRTSRTPARLTIEVSRDDDSAVNREVGPSLTHVEQSCLMTLNNLLSQDADEWQLIVPTRRHSMPAQSPTAPSSNFQALLPIPTPSSALHTLVTNLRHRYDSSPYDVGLVDNATLLRELDTRVTSLVDSGSIHPRDARLAQSLVSLLTHLNRVSIASPNSSHRTPVDFLQSSSSGDIYDTLRQQVSELQSHRYSHAPVDRDSTRLSPLIAGEHNVTWNKIDDDLDEVLRLCRERAEPVPRPYSPEAPSLPPEYDLNDYEPPTYDPAEYSETAAAKAAHNFHKSTSQSLLPQTQNSMDEKMRLDLEAVTMAIDRLYLVAPQLSNQRVELKRSKLEQMEQARASGSNTVMEGWMLSRAKRKGKAKEILGNGLREPSVFGNTSAEGDEKEVERMLELIGKASNRRFDDQSVILDGEQGMAERIERAKLRDLEKRNAFHEQLITHSNAGRLTSQDAVLHTTSSIASLNTRTRNPDALLTLPEFIREGIPDTVEQARDPEALLTLPEFVREPPPRSSVMESANNNPIGTAASKFMKKPFRPSRSRSLSAPPLSLAWLLPGSAANSRAPSPLSESRLNPNVQSGSGRSPPLRAGLDVQYVAEYQENLGSVAVFLQVNGHQAGFDIEAEVFPSGGERLIVKSGAYTSAPLSLPARVVPGKKDVKVQSGHLELKLECNSGQGDGNCPRSSSNYPSSTGLLDAAQLKALNPTSFICASCSLPLVQSSKLCRYDDLPSEHWAELLEAWMCHSDQQLSDRIASYSNGLWPAPGQALVGGSYMLFESSSLVASNFRSNQPSKYFAGDYRLMLNFKTDGPDDWQPARCICGAVTGRYRQHTSPTETISFTYRLAKYAIRPVSPTADPMKIPLSAFILQDMDEFVQAHATYRFVLLDEEEEKPRILIWMFNPHMRISYATSNHYFISRSALIQVAKVHFKILGPSVSPTLKSTLEKYPGFGQSERLLYPLDVCRRLAGLLKESNTAYPQGRRIMGGLDVGWLLRA